MTDEIERPEAHLPRSTRLFLLLVGGVVALGSLIVVLAMPELRPLDGSLAARGAQVAGGDPGFTLLLNMLGGVDSDTAWRSATVLMAFLIAIPSLWMPLTVARIFHRARAGYALLLLPPLMWLLNNGTVLVGTEFGITDEVSGDRVSLPLGMVASLTFLGLSVALLFTTYRLTRGRLVGATAVILLLAAVAGTFGWLAGVSVALSAPVLWWRNLPQRRRAIPAVLVAIVLSAGAVGAHSASVWAASSISAPDTTQASIWEDLYAGLAYPQPMLDRDSATGVTVADAEAVRGSSDRAHELFLETAANDPGGFAATLFQKALAALKHYGAMIIVIIVGLVLALTRRAHQSRSLFDALMIAVPAVVLGLGYAAATMPVTQNFSVLSAGLSSLVALSLGGLVWSVTSMPSHVRSVERGRISSRGSSFISPLAPSGAGVELSVVVPTRNGADVLPETLAELGAELGADDEIIVVENGSTDQTTAIVEEIARTWQHASKLVLIHSSPGLGEALRTGTLASRGRRLLLTADDLPFGFTDLRGFRALPPETAVAIGSKAHPASVVVRGRARMIQSRIFRFLRESLLQSKVGDSQGTLWVDGAWGREFARLSREDGLMWTTELVLAAEQQGHEVDEVPVSLVERHETGTSRFRPGDAIRSVIGFVRLAIYKDDYCNEDWERSTRPDTATVEA